MSKFIVVQVTPIKFLVIEVQGNSGMAVCECFNPETANLLCDSLNKKLRKLGKYG